MIKNPKITTIIPVYNVEAYLRETLESVIMQDLGFAERIEIVLVNDGSPDNSDVICQEYRDRYPDNIRYIVQENTGVSAARNEGLAVARGTYVHFLDSDDLISRNAYSAFLRLAKEHEKEIDFAALNIEFFEARLGGHPLNYKFTSDRVVDVDKEPDAIILHMATCLIRRSAIKHKFDPSIKISEDIKFVSELLQKKKRYGIVSSAHYYYRKRKSDDSAINSAQKDLSYYQTTPHKVYEQILKDWADGDYIHPYAQHVVMYDLQWRLMQAKQTILSADEEQAYRNLVKSLIKKIDSDIILAQRYTTAAYLRYALAIKHDGKIPREVYAKLEKRANKERPEVIVQFIRQTGDNMEIEGYVQGNPLGLEVFAFAAGKDLKLPKIENIYAEQSFLGEVVDARGPFLLKLPGSKAGGSISFHVAGSNTALNLNMRRHSRLPIAKYSYTITGGKILTNRRNAIGVQDYTITRHVISEVRWMLRIMVALKLGESAKKLYGILRSTAKDKISLRDKIYPFALPPLMFVRNIGTVFYRTAYYATKPLVAGRSVWIVSDRTTAAGDSGEVLYDYIRRQEPSKVAAYFVISRSSKDFHRMKSKAKNIINSDGIWYRILFLHASKIISTHADDHVINPFSYRVNHLNDLYSFDFIFLQHGIIRDDLSAWLNRYNKDIELFVTSAKAERDSMLRFKYYYKERNILLSGLPRYDVLESAPKNKLILAPTWRHWLAVEYDKKTGRRPYDPMFKKTMYCQFYNNLMNDKRLLEALQQHNMTAELYLHPAFESQIKDFRQNEVFVVKDFPYDYRAAFRDGTVLVSDYSSVIFDFVYLQKPIVYTQFDQDTFYDNHIYTRGYMDDERAGFGPVAKTHEQAIDDIVAVIESGCKMEQKYKQRAEKFFAWHDKNNSKRVYQAILKLDN